jgi:hypothetical protein
MAARAVERPEGSKDIRDALQQVVDLTNNLSKDGMFHNGRLVVVALSAANSEVSHQLGRVPTYIIQAGANVGGVIFGDTVHPDPRSFIYLKATVTGTYSVLIA